MSDRRQLDPRNRRVEGFNRARLKLEVRRGLQPSIVVVAGTIVALLGFGYMLTKVAPTLLTSTYEARIAVDDASNVVAGVNEVRFKGIPVGSVRKVAIDDDQAVIEVKIRKKYGRIYKDARLQLRPNTALNDMYLDIVDRGTPGAGVLEGDTPLPQSHTETPVSVDDVLNMFQPSQRLRLRTLLDELGHGLEDRGTSLQATFVQLAPFVQAAGEIANQLGERGPMVARLVHNTSVLTKELGDRQVQLRTLLTQGGATLKTLQAGSADLDATLHELPLTMQSLRTSFGAVQGTLGDVDDAVRALYPVADDLPESLSALRDLSETAAPAVSALRAPVSDLVPFAQAIQPLSANLDRATTALAPQIDTVNKVTLDLKKCKEGFQNFFQWNASISKFGDIRGPIPRGNVVFGATSSAVLNDPGEYFPEACSPGKPIGGRVPQPKDFH